jgi:hypothetical protein
MESIEEIIEVYGASRVINTIIVDQLKWDEVKDLDYLEDRIITHMGWEGGPKLNRKEIVNNMYEEILEWMRDDNVERVGDNTYIEQTTQWKKKFTLEELIKFYIKEYK